MDGTHLKNILLENKNELKENALTQQAYLAIFHAIRDLHLEPGKSFLEREIAELLEMSRTPVHEALIRLEMDGWLEIIPRKGFKVEPILKEKIIEISQISEALEGVATGLATDVLSDSDLVELDSLINKQESYMYSNDFKSYVVVDQQFHNYIVAHCNNERLTKLMESYSDQLYRARLYTIDKRKSPKHSINEHRAIVAAIRAKSPSAARKLMQEHRHLGGIEIIRIIDEEK